MNTFTRLVSLLLMLCMVFGCYPANADTEVTEATEQTATTTVVLDLGTQPTSYTIVIPSTVTLGSDGTGSATITLESGFVLTDVTSLKVMATDGFTSAVVTAEVQSEAEMRLLNTTNNSYIKCQINVGSDGYLTKETPLISVTNKTDNGESISKTMNFTVQGTLPAYGKYTGSLTFTVTAA